MDVTGFERVIGQNRVRARLMDALTQGRLAHAFLFHGPPGTGAETLAIELAKAINCQKGVGEPCQTCSTCRRIGRLQHPDAHVYTPSSSAKTSRNDDAADNGDEDGEDRGARSDARTERRQTLLARLAENPYALCALSKNDILSVDDIRSLRQEAGVKPYEARRKVALLFHADRMTTAASNALLKTLEEPPGGLFLTLVSNRPRNLLPTILSRCQPVHIGRLDEQTIQEALTTRYGIEAGRAALAARLGDGSLGKALAAAAEQGVALRQRTFDLIEQIHRGDPLHLLQTVEELIGLHKSAPILEEMFDLLIGYYRDLLLLSAGAPEQTLTHIDRLAELKQINRTTELERIEKNIRSIEEVKQAIQRNAHPQLALTVLILRLREGIAEAA
jgi:DNA polymerase-3 subunit delta'